MTQTPPPPQPTLRIVVVNTAVPADDEHGGAMAARAQGAKALRRALLEAGHDIVAWLAADRDLPGRIAQLQTDMIIVNADSNPRDVLEHIVLTCGKEPRPIVLFTDDETTSSMDAAMAAGVSAYIVAGLQLERIVPVLNVALARFRHGQKLLAELSETRQKLDERKIVERAKGILMGTQRLTEDQAYHKLRSMAMNRKLKLAEIARRIVDVKDLLG